MLPVIVKFGMMLSLQNLLSIVFRFKVILNFLMLVDQYAEQGRGRKQLKLLGIEGSMVGRGGENGKG